MAPLFRFLHEFLFFCRRQLPGFIDYFNQLTEKYFKEENPRNPWYEEYYKTYCNCSDLEESKDISLCPFTSKKRPKRLHPVQQPYIHFVRDAVYVFAHAIHNLWIDTCGKSFDTLCQNFTNVAHSQLIHYLHNVTFNDVDGFPFTFEDGTHDGPPRYSIISYMETSEGSGVYDWKEVGTYQNGKIRKWIDDFNITVKSQSLKNHFITCKRDVCPVDQIKIPDGFNDECCWHCQECHDWEYKKTEYECQKCPLGMIRNQSNPKDCSLAKEIYLDYTNPWALGAMFFAGTGLIMTTISAGIRTLLVCYRELFYRKVFCGSFGILLWYELAVESSAVFSSLELSFPSPQPSSLLPNHQTSLVVS